MLIVLYEIASRDGTSSTSRIDAVYISDKCSLSFCALPSLQKSKLLMLLGEHCGLLRFHCCAYRATSPAGQHHARVQIDKRLRPCALPGLIFLAPQVLRPARLQTNTVLSCARCANPSTCEPSPSPQAKRQRPYRCRDSTCDRASSRRLTTETRRQAQP